MQRLLDHPVQHRRDAERPCPTAGLRDLHPSHRLRFVRPAQQLLPDARPVLAAVFAERFDVHAVDPRGTAVRHHPRVRRLHVLAAQHFVDETPSPVPGDYSASCRACLTLLLRSLGGSAAYLSGRLRHCSPRSCVSFTPRTHRSGSAPPVWPFAAVRAATMASADSSLRPGPTAHCRTSPFQTWGEVSPGIARDFRSIHPSHLRRHVPDDFGLRATLLPRPRVVASYALRVPRARALPAASFPPRLAAKRLPFGFRFPSSRSVEAFLLPVSAPCRAPQGTNPQADP